VTALYAWPRGVAEAPMSTVYVAASLDAIVDDCPGLARDWTQGAICPTTGHLVAVAMRRLDADWYAWLCTLATALWRSLQAGRSSAVHWQTVRMRMTDLRRCVSAALTPERAQDIQARSPMLLPADYAPPTPTRLAQPHGAHT
jgi:hypothetical protein